MFEVGKECKRRVIHAQHGGQTQGGMSTPSSHPIILLFTGDQGERYGYMDQFQPDGMFWYTGEGQVGDMQFVRANKALLEHKETGKRVFLFEETRKTFVRFIGEVECLGYHREERPDRHGNPRQAIVFHLAFLLPASASVVKEASTAYQAVPKPLSHASLSELRALALKSPSPAAEVRERLSIVRLRAEAVRRYALKRAAGTCEACGREAPFMSREGPFLEVHHVYRVADGSPDHPACVVAICPNCHREIHYGLAGAKLNNELISYLREAEGTPDSF